MTKRRNLSGLDPARLSLLAILVAYLTPPPAALAGVSVVEVIPANQARQHIWETITVCGLVASGKYIDSPGREGTYLNFDRPYPNQTFTVVIPGSVRAEFKEPPEMMFSGKTVCVTGLITDYRGKPEMTVIDPSQITIQGEVPSAKEPFDDTKRSAPAPPASSVTLGANPATPSLGIASADAQRHIGETATVCGLVASARYFSSTSSKPTLLNFDRPHPNNTFTVVIPEASRAKFKQPPEILFKGQIVCVTGLIIDYRGKPEIVVENPSQIVIQK
jgi:micrococcal nuclease